MRPRRGPLRHQLRSLRGILIPRKCKFEVSSFRCRLLIAATQENVQKVKIKKQSRAKSQWKTVAIRFEASLQDLKRKYSNECASEINVYVVDSTRQITRKFQKKGEAQTKRSAFSNFDAVCFCNSSRACNSIISQPCEAANSKIHGTRIATHHLAKTSFFSSNEIILVLNLSTKLCWPSKTILSPKNFRTSLFGLLYFQNYRPINL